MSVGGPERDFVGYGARPPRVVWPNGAAVALNLAINQEEGSEYAVPEGDGRNEGVGEVIYSIEPEYRDLCVESIFEYGSRAGIWRLLRMCDEYGVRPTMFSTALALERNPEVAAWVRAGSHDVCSHGLRWEEHWRLDRNQERDHIERAVASFERTCGRRPRGWYCRYGPSVATRELLVEEGGFLYDCDAYNDDLPYFTEVRGRRHLVLPYTLVYNDARYVHSQGFPSQTAFFDLCRAGLDELRREGHAGYPKMLSVGLHPRWAGQAGRAAGLRQLIEYALEAGDVWIATRGEIAAWWLDHHEEFTTSE